MNSKLFSSPSFLDEDPEDLYENAPCGYLSVLSDGTILRANQTFLNWLGYEGSELFGQKIFQELLSVGGKIFYETHLAPLLKMQGFVNEVALDLVKKNQIQIPVLTTIIQRKDSSGMTTIHRITVFNITDRKKYERELLSERQRAEKAFLEKENILSSMNCQIQTSVEELNQIVSFLEGTEPNDRQKESIHRLREASKSLTALLTSFPFTS